MRLLAVLTMCAAQLLATPVAARGLFVEFNQDLAFNAASANNASSTLLATTTQKALQGSSLLGRELVAGGPPASPPPNAVACTNTDDIQSGPTVSVLVLITTCLASDYSWIEAWVDNLATEDSRYYYRGASSNIEFVKRYIPICNGGLGNDRVEFDAAEPKPEKTIGAITFVKGTPAMDAAKAYVKAQSIDMLIGFFKAPSTNFAGYVPFTNQVTLNKYNPFRVVSLLHCATLPYGVPTQYVDSAGKRQCFCSCPIGYERIGSKCVPVEEENCLCSWDQQNNGYVFEILAGETNYESYGECSIKGLATSSFLPVPVVFDNYVARHRDNERDGDIETDASAPQLMLSHEKKAVAFTQNSVLSSEDGDSGFTSHFTWKDFVETSGEKVDAVEFTAVGKYSLTLTAKDYSEETATCEACVVVVDKRRPNINPLHECPTSNTGSCTTALTDGNLNVLQNTLNGITRLKDNAQNDPCGTNVRCDYDTHKVKAFNADDYPTTATESHTGLGDLFTPSVVKDDLMAKLDGTIFDATRSSGLDEATEEVECTRCVTATTALKEWYVPYKCGSGPVNACCDGDADASCTTEQCVKVNGQSLATATATLKADIISDSKDVVKHLNGDVAASDATLMAKYELDSTVHIALECTDFPPSPAAAAALLGEDEAAQITPSVCSYSSKVSDLLDVAVARVSELFSETEVDDFVEWRYQIDGGAWKLLTTGDAETFDKAKTTIKVEAWTRCGMVADEVFDVKLHLNNEVEVCDHFSRMWYQTTAPPLLSSPSEFCMYPKSDFAEVTFDYHPNIGLNFDPAKFHMSIARIECKIRYAGKSEVIIVDTGATPVSGETFEVVKQFAIDGVDTATTKENTQLSISCDFTYSRQPDTSTVVHRCPMDIVVKDCSPPEINKPCELDGHCDYNQCSISGNGDADLFQACGGHRVTQASDGSTSLLDADIEASCCASCDASFAPTCVAIQSFPTTSNTRYKPIKRCEAVPVTTYSYYLMAKSAAEGHGYAMMTSLLGASAMVAVVALVVVRRRRSEATKAPLEEGAYYPLLG